MLSYSSLRTAEMPTPRIVTVMCICLGHRSSFFESSNQSLRSLHHRVQQPRAWSTKRVVTWVNQNGEAAVFSFLVVGCVVQEGRSKERLGMDSKSFPHQVPHESGALELSNNPLRFLQFVEIRPPSLLRRPPVSSSPQLPTMNAISPSWPATTSISLLQMLQCCTHDSPPADNSFATVCSCICKRYR